MDRPVYSLHLFAGAGGGILADILAGVRPVCAVEIEPYPQRVLRARFPGLSVWDDVCTFRADNPECADAFAWLREHRADLVVAGGFPCQDISCAGAGRGVEGGERSGLWREFARILGEIRPRFAFVENSPFLVGRGLGIVLGDLASLGYDARWQVLAAGDVGARHLRERIWIAASLRDADEQLLREGGGVRECDADRRGADAHARNVPDAGCRGGELQRGGCVLEERGRTLDGVAETGGNHAAPRFPTPSRRDYRHGCDHPHGFGQRNLNDLALQYPTPRAHDRLPGGGNSEMNRHTPGLNAIAALYDTPTVHGDGGSGRKGTMPKFAQLNPDWVEWLMGWPVGWTDITRDECDWRDLSNEPDDIHIATTRRDNRAKRIKAIGNGQVPLCAAVAAEFGFAFLESLFRANPGAK